jgi:hypothetical protein
MGSKVAAVVVGVVALAVGVSLIASGLHVSHETMQSCVQGGGSGSTCGSGHPVVAVIGAVVLLGGLGFVRRLWTRG